jgi:hypothetical protein
MSGAPALSGLVAACRSRLRLRRTAAGAETEREARREASLIIAAARAEGDRIVAEAEALQASLAAAVVVAQQTLARINGHLAEATQNYKRLETRCGDTDFARAGSDSHRHI